MREPPKRPDPKRFYVVWSPQGGPPVVRYPTFESARAAATRLSHKLPEKDFFVLASCWGRIARPAAEGEPEAVAVDPTASDAPHQPPADKSAACGQSGNELKAGLDEQG